MKKTLSVMAVSAFIFTANYAFAGGVAMKTDGCPDDCQREIDTLHSNQARQDEQIKDQNSQITQQAAQISTLQQDEVYPWYVKGVGKMTMFSNLGTDAIDRTTSIGFDTSSTGYGVGGGIGRQFGQFRVDGIWDTNKTDLDNARVTHLDERGELGVGSGDIRINTLMLNGYYDIPVADIWAAAGDAWSVYGMFGMGYANVTMSVYNVDDNEKTFAYKGGVGVTYSFAGNQAVDLGWEYLGVGDVVIGGLDVNDINSNNIILGYRYSFSF